MQCSDLEGGGGGGGDCDMIFLPHMALIGNTSYIKLYHQEMQRMNAFKSVSRDVGIYSQISTNKGELLLRYLMQKNVGHRPLAIEV